MESRGGVTTVAAGAVADAFGESRGRVTAAAGAAVAAAGKGIGGATSRATGVAPGTVPFFVPVGSLSPLSHAVSPEPRRSHYRADGPFRLVLRSRVPLPTVLPQPLELSLTVFPDPLSDYLCASRPLISRDLSALVTHPSPPPHCLSQLLLPLSLALLLPTALTMPLTCLRAALAAPHAIPGGPQAAPAALIAAPCGPLSASAAPRSAPCDPPTAPCCCLPCFLRCPASARPACCATMASLRVLEFNHEGRPIQFDMWLDDLQLYLLSHSSDSWLTHDAAARLAIRNHLPLAECAHFRQHRTSQALYDAVVARYSSPATAALGPLLLPYLFPELSDFATVEDLFSHLRTSDARYHAAAPAEDHFLSLDPTILAVDLLEQHHLAAETSVVTVGAARGTPRTPFFKGCSSSPLAPSYASVATADVLGAEDVGAASASAKCRNRKGKGGRGGGGGSGGGGGGSSGGGGSGGPGDSGSGGGSGGIGGSGGGSGGGAGLGGSGSRGGWAGATQRGGSSGGQRQQQQRRSETPSLQQLCEWFSQRGHDAWRVEFVDEAERPRWAELLSVEGECYLCVPPNPGIEAAALGASESALPGTAPAEALHTFTLDSGASRFFFRDSTTLTPLFAPVPVRLADPSEGLVLALSSTVLPCAAVPSGSLSGLHLPSFSTNLVSASGQVAPPCSCRLLSHQTLLWHHRLGHPSLPRLRGMHSRLLFSGLPRSLPPLLSSPAPPCLPCVEGRQRAAPHSSSFPPMIASLQTLHMEVWGPAHVSGQSRERYFLLHPRRSAEPRRPAVPRRPTEPRRPAEPRHPTEPHCPARAAPTAIAAVASPNVLTFDAEGRAADFDVWVDDLQLFLQCDSKDGVSLFDYTSGVSLAPAATTDSMVRLQWTTRDTIARLAVRSHLPSAERAHFGQYKTAKSLYDDVVARYSSPSTAALSRLIDARYRAALPILVAAVGVVEAATAVVEAETAEVEVAAAQVLVEQLREWYAGRGRSGGVGPCTYVFRTGGRRGETCGLPHTTQRCFSRLTDAWRAQFPDAVELPHWGDLLKQNVAIFDLDFDAILAAMYAATDSAEGDCYLCVPPDPGTEAAALGASDFSAPGTSESAAPGAGESAPSGTAPTEALHTFTLDSGASRSFFRDSTTLTPLSRPVAVSLADPSGGPVLVHSSTVLPCSAAPSGLLSGLHLPSFSTNLVSGADLQDVWVDQFTPGGQRVTHSTCSRTGRHLATFTRRPGSSLYTLTTASPPVNASGQVAASGKVFATVSRSSPASAPCSCRPLTHETLLWHHRLGHPSLPRLRGMASRALVSGLPRSLPPLPPRTAPTCVEGRQRAAPHSSEFPPIEAPLQTLHMDVWGLARVHRGGVFSSDLLRAFSRAEGIRQTFTLPASPRQNGIAERRIGMVMDVA
ncbi:unnamed protein product [Closterium sp. NIES-53]